MSHRVARILLTIFVIGAFLLPAACSSSASDDTPIASSTPLPLATPLPVADRKGGMAGEPGTLKHYTSPDLAFSVDYPDGWQVSDKNPVDEGIVFQAAGGKGIFWVRRQRLGGSAVKANNAGIAFLQKTIAAPDPKAVTYSGKPAEFRLSGLTGLDVDYRYTDAAQIAVKGSLIAVTTDQSDTYLVVTEAPQSDYAAVTAGFDALFASFRISGVLVGPSTPRAAPPAQRTEAEWLVMFYEDADDSILERDMMVDFNEIERVGSTDQVHMVAQVDRYRGGFSGMGDWSTAKRFYITQDNDLGRIASTELADLGEVNMADGNVLADFITWAVVNYPARKHVLIMSDHGAGWPGGFSDGDFGGKGKDKVALADEMDDGLWLMEIDQALTKARAKTNLDKFELIGLDACLMSMLEVHTMLAAHARYAVASEETEPSLGWAYTSFLNRLVTNPGMNGGDLGRAIVDSYIQQDQRIVDNSARRQLLKEMDMDAGLNAAQTAREFGVDVTLSAVDLSAIEDVDTALDGLADVLMGLERKPITSARSSAQRFENIFADDTPSPYIDLGNFVKTLRAKSSDSAVKKAADRVLAALGQAVIAERHGSEKPGATGISIYFPNRTIFKQTKNDWDYATIASRFAQEHRWDDFLDVYYGVKQPPQQTAQRSLARDVSLAKPVQIEPLKLSAETAAPGKPVNIQTHISGNDLGFVYTFAGYVVPAESQLIVEDMDYLFADDTREVDGVAYPAWPKEGVDVDFDWEPVLYAINDGKTSVRALLMPETYGDKPTYAVDGTYAFADGSPARPARLIFRDGELSQVFGYTGSSAVGAPRQITPQAGDRFTVLEHVRKLVQGTQQGESSTRPGGTLTFGDDNLTVEQSDAPSGSFVVGFIAESLEGQRSEQYESVFVENGKSAAVPGYKPYTNESLGFALLYPEAWKVQEDDKAGDAVFSAPQGGQRVMVTRTGYRGKPIEDANAQGMKDAVAAIKIGGELKDVKFARKTDDYLLGALPARMRSLTATSGGQAVQGSVVVATPVDGTTYTVLLLAPEAGYEAAQAVFQPMLDSFDILVSGISKDQVGAAPPAFGKVSFTDSFDNRKSGLVEGTDETGTSAYTGGRFEVEMEPGAGPVYDYYEGKKLPANFILQAKVSYSDSDNNGFGVIFRVTAKDDFYAFRISGDGFYTVERTKGDGIEPIVTWTPADLIETKQGAANVLTVVGQGEDYSLYINDHQIAAFKDSRYEGGTFGIITDNFDEEAKTTIAFDDYRVGVPAQ